MPGKSNMRRPSLILIAAPILVTSLLLLALGSAAGLYVNQLNQQTSDRLMLDQHCAWASGRLVLSIRDMRLQLRSFVETGDPLTLATVIAIRQNTSQQLGEAAQSATTDEVRAKVAYVRDSHDRFFHEVGKALKLEPASQRVLVQSLLATVSRDLLAPAESLLESVQQSAAIHNQRNRVLADRIGLGFLLLGGCGAAGGLLFGFGMARVVSRRIEQSECEANRSDQLAAIGQLAAGLAHELRNPLTAIRALVEAGQEEAGGTVLDERDLQVLYEEIARLEKLVDSFLDFARPSQPARTRLDAESLVRQVLQLIGGEARRRSVTIELKGPAHGVALDADPAQLRQVLLNLLLNAMDAAGEGGRVTVELNPETASGNGGSDPSLFAATDRSLRRMSRQQYHQIDVYDNGPGIAAELRAKIFEPFVSSKETGLGLGLAVSRRIVEAHGGQIEAADNPGGGARFTVRLPSGTQNSSCELSSCKPY
jgi:two-component system, NtrC family, sensor histidine kinase HydH